MNSINKSSMLIASLAAVVLASGSAFAGSVDDLVVPSEVVKFHDLNLDSQAGVAVLYHRIVNASGRVCGVGDSKDLGAKQKSESCARESIARAVVKVNSDSLTAYYENKTGQFTAKLASR